MQGIIMATGQLRLRTSVLMIVQALFTTGGDVGYHQDVIAGIQVRIHPDHNREILLIWAVERAHPGAITILFAPTATNLSMAGQVPTPPAVLITELLQVMFTEI
jgi:hypothetical protein